MTDEKTPVATVSLLITRDAMTIIPSTVPVYEAEVAKAVFGEDNVEVLDAPSAPTSVETTAEAERLVARYGSEKVEATFGTNYKGAINKAVADAVKLAAAVIESAKKSAK